MLPLTNVARLLETKHLLLLSFAHVSLVDGHLPE